MTAFGRLESALDWNTFMGFLSDFSLGGGGGVALGLLLSGERGRLRGALRICGGAPGCNKRMERAGANVYLLEFMEDWRSTLFCEARVVDLVAVVVPAALEDVANAGTDAEGLWVKKSVNLLFLSLVEALLADISVAGDCLEDGRQ